MLLLGGKTADANVPNLDSFLACLRRDEIVEIRGEHGKVRAAGGAPFIRRLSPIYGFTLYISLYSTHTHTHTHTHTSMYVSAV